MTTSKTCPKISERETFRNAWLAAADNVIRDLERSRKPKWAAALLIAVVCLTAAFRGGQAYGDDSVCLVTCTDGPGLVDHLRGCENTINNHTELSHALEIVAFRAIARVDNCNERAAHIRAQSARHCDLLRETVIMGHGQADRICSMLEAATEPLP